MIADIEGFELETDGNKQYVNAKTYRYIESAPKVLCVQLNRIYYQNNQQIKSTHELSFEREFHINRFKFENREYLKTIRK